MKKILLVDDDDNVLEFLRIILEDSPNKLLEARSGKEAIRKSLVNYDIALIIMDFQMPGLDGIETGRQIREFDQNVKIIIHSSALITEIYERSVEVGFQADAIIGKCDIRQIENLLLN